MIVWRLLFSSVLHFWTVIFLLWNSPVHWCCWHEPTLSTHTRTRLSGTTRVSRYQKGKTNLDFTGARDSEWQWHQLGCMQVCTSLQTDNHASTLPLSFFTGPMPFLPRNQQRQSTEPTLYVHIYLSLNSGWWYVCQPLKHLLVSSADSFHRRTIHFVLHKCAC